MLEIAQDNDGGNSQDDFRENDLHMLPMWKISLQDAGNFEKNSEKWRDFLGEMWNL